MKAAILALASSIAFSAPIDDLGRAVDQLRKKGVTDARLAEVELYLVAARWLIRYQAEFPNQKPEPVIESGLVRAREALAGRFPWEQQKGRVVRAYRSKIDATPQPYAITVPESYDSQKPAGLDVILHGRDNNLTMVKFIADREKPPPAQGQMLRLEVFGRGNNAYRWAGETDVFEALEHVRARYNVDPARIVLRGFSMGGAGAWHLGLHHPDRWAAVEAGAGFTETRVYAKLGKVSPMEESLLRIYDAVDYAPNAANLPMVGYGGELDPQLRASVNIRERLAAEGLQDLRMLFLVGPRTEHRWHPDSLAESNRFLDAALAGERKPEKIRFVTYTTRYSHCHWITVEGIEQGYQRAEVEADRTTGEIHTKNVSHIRVHGFPKIRIDGQEVETADDFVLWKRSGRWVPAGAFRIRKRPGLQGPIDDAFMNSFLVVEPTGRSPNPKVLEAARTRMNQFIEEWRRWMHGEVQIKRDRDVTAKDLASFNIILFGDPWSNRAWEKAHQPRRLPAVFWTKRAIIARRQIFSNINHLLVSISPNPSSRDHYLVVNSGHTFNADDFKGTNARLYPRLGDWSILNVETGLPVAGGFFSQYWTLN